MTDLSVTPEIQKKLARLKELEELQARRHSQKIAQARRDYRTFAENCLRDESTGNFIKLAEIHKKWIEHVHYAWSNGLNAAILAPYGHGKTAHCSVGMPLFMFGQDPSLRLMMVSANDKLASERLVLIRQYIDTSDEYHEIFPHVRADENMGWTKTSLFLKRPTFAKDPSLSTCGATSSGIGKRADILILDDINDAKNTLHQPKMRDVIWRNFTGVFLSRLEPGGKVMIIACVTGETLILMDDGSWRRLDSLHAGDRVQSWADGQRKVGTVQGLVNQGKDEIFEIRTGNHAVLANAKHPFLVQTDLGVVWRLAKNLQPGDKAVVVGASPSDTVAKLSAQEAWLLGFMFGDGWITLNKKKNFDKQRNKHYDGTSIVTCWAHGVDTTLESEVLRAFSDLFGVAPRKTRFGYYRTEVAAVGRWFTDHGLVGKAATKRLPTWLFQQPADVRQRFLDGLVAADGHENKTGRISVSLCNGDLVTDLKVLAEGLGYKVSNVYYRQIPNTAPHSTTDRLCDSFNIQWQNEVKVDTDFVFETIRSIEPAGIADVWDIAVEGTENFIANGFVTHNTRWHEQDLIGQILEDDEMRSKYALLIQRVSDDFTSMECETIIPAGMTDRQIVKHRSELDQLFRQHENKIF